MDYTKLSDEEKRAYWQEHVAKQRKSGLSLRAYCAGEKISVATFRDWRKKLLPKNSGLIKVEKKTLGSEQNFRSYELVINGKIILRFSDGYDEQELSSLLQLLGAVQ